MDWRKESLQKQLFEKHGFPIDDICRLDQYDCIISKKVLSILLEWACYGQNEAGIMLGRGKIAEIPRDWLKKHLLETINDNFDYWDDWNYRRLMELVVELLPENKNDFLTLNCGTTNPDLREVIDDYM